MADLGDAPIEEVVGALVEHDRDLANDLLLAVGRFTAEEMRAVARDGTAGRNVSERVTRVGRLERVRSQLERKLGLMP